MWYAEQKTFDGRWTPIKCANYPAPVGAEDTKREYRNIKGLDKDTENWPLESLRQMFNPSEGGISFKSARK